jgi:hypothetical protein
MTEALRHGKCALAASVPGRGIGFPIRVFASGKRAFILRYRIGRASAIVHHRLLPSLDVTAARKRAGELTWRVDHGEDPMGQRHE